VHRKRFTPQLTIGPREEILAPEPFPAESWHASEQDEPVLLDYLKILFRRRWTMLGVTLLVTGAATAVSFKMTPKYRAESQISIDKGDPEAFGLKDSNNNPLDETAYNMELDGQEKILSSDTLILQVLRALNVVKTNSHSNQSDPDFASTSIQHITKEELDLLAGTRARLEVSRVPHTTLFDIRYTSPDPDMAARFANKLVEVYVEQNFRAKYTAARQVAGWLSKELEDVKTNIAVSQAKLALFQKQTGIFATDDTHNIVTQKLDDLNRELTIAQEDRIQKWAVYMASTSGDVELMPGVSDNPIVKQLKEQQAQVANNYAQASTQLGAAHPRLQALRNQLEQIKASLQTEVNKIAERNRNAYLIAQRREDMLAQALDQQKQLANELNEKATVYEILKHDVLSSQQLYDTLSQKLKAAGMSAGLKSANVRVVDYAHRPYGPSVPNIPLNIALGFISGVLCGGTLAFLQDRLDTSVRTPRDAEIVSALPLVGVVPRVTGLRRSRGASELQLSDETVAVTEPAIIAQPRAPVEMIETYRALRMSLLAGPQGPPQVIMVTSALPNEGKTTTSVNCAFVLAQTDARVLLVDADLKAPRIHTLLGLPLNPGLSFTLTEGAQEGDHQSTKLRISCIQSGRIPGLSVLTAGSVSPDSMLTLDSRTMKKRIAEWRKEYTYIVIDTPPVLCSSGALELAANVDSVLLSIFAGRTPRAALLRARDMLLGVNARLRGIILNGVDRSSSDYVRYSYYPQPEDHSRVDGLH
jgi:polysaccharide biosynthesis transport protein